MRTIHRGGDDLDRRLDRDFEREPSIFKRQRIPLVETGTVRALCEKPRVVPVEKEWSPYAGTVRS